MINYPDVPLSQSSEAVTGAGDQEPQPEFDEYAYSRSLAQAGQDYFDGLMADMLAREKAQLAEIDARILAQAAQDLADQGRAMFEALPGVELSFHADVGSAAFQQKLSNHEPASNNGQLKGECYSLGVEFAGLPASSNDIVAGRSVTSGAPIEQGTVTIAAVNTKTGAYPSSSPHGHTVVFDKLGDGSDEGKGFWGYHQWSAGTSSNGKRRDFFRFDKRDTINGGSGYYVALKRMP